MHVKAVLLAPMLALALSGCAHQRAQTLGRNSRLRCWAIGHIQERRRGWVDTKLYFGLGPADQPDKGINEAEWRSFLDQEVTPRFAGGLSVVDVYGQWQGKNQRTPERLRTKMLIIDYPDTAENRAKVDAIRAAWKEKTGDQSVMRVTEPADVSF